MKNTLFMSALVVIIIFAGFGCYKKTVGDGQLNQDGNKNDEPIIIVSKPWIEVLAASTTLYDAEGKVVRQLLTGDELEPGSIIGTNKNGLANINFPDGSVARLDSNTKITLEVGDYDAASKTLTVRIKLATGKMWSKILKLATPGSFWEVKTSNAAAAVRGTAFGMTYLNGKTRIFGSQNQVAAKPLDPNTGEPLLMKETIIGEEKYLVIDSSLIGSLRSDKSIVDLTAEIVSAPGQFLEEDWIKRSIEADEQIDGRLAEFVGQGLSEIEAIVEYGDEFRTESTEAVLKRRLEIKIESGINSAEATEATTTINLLDTGAPSAR